MYIILVLPSFLYLAPDGMSISAIILQSLGLWKGLHQLILFSISTVESPNKNHMMDIIPDLDKETKMSSIEIFKSMLENFVTSLRCAIRRVVVLQSVFK